MSATITDFLLARIAEDEAAAKRAAAVCSDHWTAMGSILFYLDAAEPPNGDPLASTENWKFDDAWRHVERHDPARVLAECEAKRRIVYRSMNGYPPAPDYERGWREGLERSLRDLAAVYADHPDYQEAWRP